MTAAWDVFVDSLDPKTIRATELPAVRVVLRERFGGARHREMLAVHELNRAKFRHRRGAGDLELLSAESAGWDDRRYTFTDTQLRIAMNAVQKQANEAT
ncbi:hypothetical protein [Cryobacterium sp. BB736]|uniref:hypothetical protein n=1 Tax=Cryobacterium sp. BB736 TaxID=2746963 RepID=UPI001876AF59|nr:hypothetical protein [Cryobacterium sp. BB736]